MIKPILTKSMLAIFTITLTAAATPSFAQPALTGVSHHVQPMGDPGAPTPDPTGDGN